MTNINTMKVGSKELDLRELPLQDAARAAQEEMSGLIVAKGQVLTSNLPSEPLKANIDAPKVTMALINLLNNAMHFTPAKGQIQLNLEKHGSEGWLSVVDTGAGIPEDQVNKIFDQFYQVENHMTRHHQGMGLGLSIVQAIAEAHDGRVWAESPGTDQGATFTIALPLS
jgi:signal transduction histidine kinase